jgi:hypothetical protein
MDAYFRTVNPGEFASPEGFAGSGQHKEKLFDLDTFKRALDRKLGAVLRNIPHLASTAPGSINRNDMNVDAARELNTGA